MKIIRSTELIPIEHPVICLYGQPGIGKTSLGYSAKDPLLLDFDQGAHRAVNRRDTLVIERWADAAELTESKDALASYSTIVVDTVGRLLDLLSADIIDVNPKHGRDGALTLQGFGVLKSRFRGWMTQLRLMGKDVVLIAHGREDRDNDAVIMRPDIQGGSYGEVMKLSDLLGFVYMRGRDRVIDFTPSDRWHAKSPSGFKPITLPPVAKAQHVLTDIITQARTALGAISAESAQVAQSVEDWRSQIDTFTTTDECTKAIEEIYKLPPVAIPAVKLLLMKRAKVLGFLYDTTKKAFVKESTQPEAATV